ncbi:hypothetical protein ACEPPN_019285 [Leptodophora sp. 'Broadleaf-Isolate-01']
MSSFTLASVLRTLILLASITPGAPSPVAQSSSGRLESRTNVLPLTVNTIYQADVPTWHENLAVRANGQLLVTRMDGPILELIDPAATSKTPIIINNFGSAYAGCLGITELGSDIFYVVAAAPFGSDFVKTSGNSSVFKVDLNTFAADSNGVVVGNPIITKIADLPTAGFLNGMTTLNVDAGLVVIADSLNGTLYTLNVKTGTYNVTIDDAKMKALSTAITPLGINGVKIRNGCLYFSNTGNPIFSRIPISSTTGAATGSSSVVATVLQSDDFVFRADGTAWFSQNQIQCESVVKNGMTTLVAGNSYSTTLAGVTAGQFGRSKATANILYLTTNGGLAVPVNGSVIVPGKVAYIDTSSFA